MGLFYPFLSCPTVRMVGVEAGGYGIHTGQHAARFSDVAIGVLHGTMTRLLQDANGQIRPTHSISAGLDYPAVGPEHSFYAEKKRIEYTAVTDDEALKGFQMLAALEGILPALESAHAIAYLLKRRRSLLKDKVVIVNLSGRGDKDVAQLAKMDGFADTV